MPNSDYVIYGSEFSPFSVKVRSYFRYKNISHEWRPRTLANLPEFQALAKLPLVPLVHCPNEDVLQDSTPIIEKMEELFPDTSIVPPEPESAFISYLIEEYADEWVNKPMFHYRWWREEDQIAVADALAAAIQPDGSKEDVRKMSAQLRARMVPRLSFVGSSEENKEIIENSFKRLLKLLEPYLKSRAYLFGGRPSFADFGLFGQLYCCTQQPTTLKILEGFPAILKWIDRMLDPKDLGDWESWETISADLMPIVKDQVADLYLPWAVSNRKALVAGEAVFSADLKDGSFKQDTVKYAGRSLTELTRKYSMYESSSTLNAFLKASGCLEYLVDD